MPLQAPNLDDRTFQQIVDDARRLIPRYAREWTDHNETDPGITLIQLFAWMTEMTLYRLNQVPERSYIKFLELLGIELQPARPARAELTFELARDDALTVIVPRGTEVAGAGADGEDEPLVFETDESLVALGAKLAAVQSFDGFAYTALTTKNAAADQWFHPFGAGAREGAALVLGFDSPLPMTAEEINLAVEVATGEIPAPRCCDGDLGGLPPPSTLEWEFWDRSSWQPLSPIKDETRAFTRSGHVYLRGPGERAKKDFLGAVADRELYWLRAVLSRSGYDQAPRLSAVLTNTVRATEGQTVRDEVLGGSDGRANQRFTLANAPVLRRDEALRVTAGDGRAVEVTSLLLEVNEGATDDDFEPWQEVDDFFASGADDPHYLLDRTTGEIRFGDGRHGRIPVANPDNPGASVVAREYRYGGGRRGNVGAGALTELQSLVDGVAEVTNLRPALGGADEETLEEAKLRAPAELKAKERAVTAEDFEFLARETPGVRIRRAKALPLVHPRYTGARVPGVVTVVVVPDAEGERPLPSEETLRAVCVHLDRHRLLTSELYVVAPRYREVVIEADVVARGEADLGVVQRGVVDALGLYFHALQGGEDGQGWEFGRDVFYSRVYRVLLDVEGVDRILDNQLEIWLDGERQPFCRDAKVGDGELLFSGEHRIRVAYDRGEE